MTNSILMGTKRALNIEETDTAFDTEILMYINGSLSKLEQIGIGPSGGFMIEGAAETWEDLLGVDRRLNSVKTLVYMEVRLVFDPPTTSYLIDALKEQIAEITWRVNVTHETVLPLPQRAIPPIENEILDGGHPY